MAARLLIGTALPRFDALAAAIPLLLLFGLFVKMSNGATYAVVPFVNRRALGAVSGIVGAGGNAGAVAAGFLFHGSLDWSLSLLILGIAVTISSCLVLTLLRWLPEEETTQAAVVPELAA